MAFKAIARQLEVTDPELHAAVVVALADEMTTAVQIQRSLEAVGVEIGYSSLCRWRDHVRR